MTDFPKFKFIIADDHKLFRVGLESVVRSFPFVECVDHAENGKEVITLLEKQPYDIVFMDISMPVLSGIEATEIVTKKFPHVKVIAVSMFDDRGNIIAMLRRGAKGYILKNSSIEDIGESIKTVMSGKRFFSSEVSEVLLKEVKSIMENEDEKHTDVVILKEKHLDVIFLLCYEFGNEEIGKILKHSHRTIETYRKEASVIIGCEGLGGLIKYGIETELHKESGRLKEFKSVLEEKKVKK